MAYTLMGYTINSVEQARSVLVIAKLSGRQHIIEQALAIIAKYEKQ